MLCALVVGCYEHHVVAFDDRDGGRDVLVRTDSSFDGGSDVSIDAPPDAPPDVPITPGCGFVPMCGRTPRGEVLRMSFEDDLRVSGAWATTPVVDEGTESFVSGRFGRGVQLESDTVIRLPRTAGRLGRAGELTFAFWLRELEQTDGKSFLRCRTFTSGFEIYRGVTPSTANICVGSVSGGGACTGYPLEVDGCWHHFVLRWRGARRFEVFVDGAQLVDIVTSESIFGSPGDLTLGERAGGAARTGTMELDELVVWDRALDDDEVMAAACR